MKIHSIRIDGFGKLGDYTADFSDGIHCVRRENEFGKSTILAFIRAMFYGFPKRANKARDVRNFSRGKYSPWKAGGYGGTLTFSHKGRTYRIERRFSGSRSEDRVVLRDERTGAAEDTGDQEIGEYLFGLGEAEFVNTFFVGQLEIRLNEEGRETKSVADRLANLATDGSEFYSFDKADKNLKEAVTDLLAARGGGLIRGLEKEQEELAQRLRDSEDDFLRIEEIVGQMDEKTKEADQLDKDELFPLSKRRADQTADVDRRRKVLSDLESDRIRATERTRALQEMIRKQLEYERSEKERREKRAARIRNLQQEAAELDRNRDERTAEWIRIRNETEEWTAGYEAKIPELQETHRTAVEEVVRVREEADRLEKEGARFSGEAIEADAARFRQSIRIPILITLVLFAVAVIGPIFAAVFRTPVLNLLSIVLLPAAIPLSYAVVRFMRRRATNARVAEERAEYERVLRQVRQELSEAILKERDTETEYDRFSERSRSETLARETKRGFIEERLETIKSNTRKIREEAESLLNEEKREALDEERLKTESQGPNGEKKDPNVEHREIKEHLVELEVQIKAASESLKQAEAEEERLKKDEERIRSEIERLRQEASRLSGIAESLTSECSDPSEIEEKIRATVERIARAAEYHRTLLLATEVMAEASKEMESRFAPRVNEIAGRYLARLSGDRYAALRFDRGFKVEISDRQDGMYYEADYFSAGTVDQVYLALRLAIADLIDDSEDKLPILLDDALVQYDDERAERAVSLLRELSAERQIIMFTCHKSIEAHFNGEAAPVKRKTRKSIDG